MNRIGLALVPHPDWPHFTVAITIDGETLTERVRRAEAHYRELIGADPSVSRYRWAQARDLLLPGRHLLGTPNSPWCPGFSEVLVCSCGEAVCGAIAVQVRVGREHVGWLAWRQFPLAEAWRLCEFRPLIFRRSQYEAELARVSNEYEGVRNH